ncbi:hypothetical protein GJW-30_1_01076 [Variibacter gotjawalensis]|uniref:Uncharacterized protein n=2 Tax=Variibacter gotjawalensis TaxID=1333996 RepID=A0A0S3PRJ1_9BRAD|nr:hypothetical protein GJW-30_1_01076 [Variibacter gotjawalensis]
MRQTFLSDRTSYAFTVLTEADSDGLRLGVYGELTEVEGSIDGERVALDPLSLDGQTCDASGTVVMPGGSIVRGITFARRLSPNNDLTDEERKILSLVVAFVDPDNRYGLWRLLVSDTGIQSKLPEALEKATVFDFAHVGALKLPSLKELHWRVREHMPAISASKVQRALERAGIRRPRSGPRSRRGPRSATIACVNDLMRE